MGNMTKDIAVSWFELTSLRIMYLTPVQKLVRMMSLLLTTLRELPHRTRPGSQPNHSNNDRILHITPSLRIIRSTHMASKPGSNNNNSNSNNNFRSMWIPVINKQ